MVNRTNLQLLIDTLKEVPAHSFDMARWPSLRSDIPATRASREALEAHRCGSAACIGGWCELLFTKEDVDSRRAFVAEVLGIDNSRARNLCFGLGVDHSATLAEAIEVLECLRDDEVVEWRIIPRIRDASYEETYV